MSIKLAIALLAATPLLASAADRPLIPVDHFVERDTYSMPRLSPDGKHIAVNVRVKRNGRMAHTISVYALPELKNVAMIGMAAFEIPTNFEWVSNERLVVTKGREVGDRQAPEATGEVVSVNLDGSKPQYLYGYDNYKQNTKGVRYGDDYGFGEVAFVPPELNNRVLLSTYLWSAERSMLYEIETVGSARKLLADVPARHLTFHVQNNGTARFATGTDDNNIPVVYRKDDAADAWKKLDFSEPNARYHPFAFTPDDKSVYVSHSPNGGPYVVMLEDLASGKRTTVASDPIGSVDVQYTSKPHLPFAYSTEVAIPKASYLLPDHPDAQLHKTLSAAFPKEIVRFINFSNDGQRLLFAVASDRDPGSYYLYDRKTAKAELLFTNMENIEPDQMAERRPITFKSRDGVTLTGFLTIPQNAGKDKVPMVLLPHGGPFKVNDEWYFDTDAQFLASRGYAVLQVNFRGSGGRGMDFEASGYKQFGGKIMDDLVDGVKYANGLDFIDGKRVCVFGASFGGYSALMLPVREPAMFKCSVGYAGVYHLPSTYAQEGLRRSKGSRNYWLKTMGDDMPTLDKQSPASLASQIKLPVLLVHGGNDKVTELKQATMMRDALIAAGNTPEFILEKDEGHGFYDEQRRKAFYEKLETFLAKHIGK